MTAIYKHYDRLTFMHEGDIKYGEETVGQLTQSDDAWQLKVGDKIITMVASRFVGMAKAAELWGAS